MLSIPSLHDQSQEDHNSKVLDIMQEHSAATVTTTSDELNLMKAELLRYV